MVILRTFMYCKCLYETPTTADYVCTLIMYSVHFRFPKWSIQKFPIPSPPPTLSKWGTPTLDLGLGLPIMGANLWVTELQMRPCQWCKMVVIIWTQIWYNIWSLMNFWMNAMISGEFPEKRNLFILGNFAQFLSARLNSVRIFIHRLIMFQKDFFFYFYIR